VDKETLTYENEMTWRVRKVKGIRWHQCMFCPKVRCHVVWTQ